MYVVLTVAGSYVRAARPRTLFTCTALDEHHMGLLRAAVDEHGAVNVLMFDPTVPEYVATDRVAKMVLQEGASVAV